MKLSVGRHSDRDFHISGQISCEYIISGEISCENIYYVRFHVNVFLYQENIIFKSENQVNFI